jgi:cytochrome c oxidase subunit III
VSPIRTRREAGSHQGGEIPDFASRLRRARIGLGLALAMVTMTFAVFSVTFVLRRWFEEWPGVDSSTPVLVAHWTHLRLPYGLLFLNTLVLLLSGAAMEMARRQVTKRAALAPIERLPGISLGRERNLPWLPATIVLGCGFVAGQMLAWHQMATRGIYLATTPNATFVYLATILHAIHVGAGLLALLGAGALAVAGASWDSRRIVVDVTAWYWHFMAGLWVYLFGLVAVMNS